MDPPFGCVWHCNSPFTGHSTTKGCAHDQKKDGYVKSINFPGGSSLVKCVPKESDHHTNI